MKNRAQHRPLRLLPWSLFALLPLLVVACAAVGAGEARQDPIHLVVLHTNDVHGQVLPRERKRRDGERETLGGILRLSAAVQRERASLNPGTELLVLDAGDWYQGTPEGLVDRGEAFVRALVSIGYDAMCVGNHEFDHGIENLTSILSATSPPAVMANLYVPPPASHPGGGDDAPATQDMERVDWVAPWRVVERAGLRIALVGLVAPETPEISHEDTRGFVFGEPAAALARAMEELGDDVDLVIPLTHLAVSVDRRLARAFPELPLIVGGHSHTWLDEGLREGETLIVQAGDKGQALGRVDLWVDPSTGQVLESKARLERLTEDDVVADRDLAELCERILAESEASMSAVIGEFPVPMVRSRGLETSTAGNWITDMMRIGLEGDCALQNRGGIRNNLEAGPVTRREVFEVLPFGNTVVLMELSGAQLFETVRRAVEGGAHSGLDFSGFEAQVRVDEAGVARLVDLILGGKSVDHAASYRVATNSFLARGGDRYIDADEGDVLLDTGIVLRELFEQALGSGQEVDDRSRFHVEED